MKNIKPQQSKSISIDKIEKVERCKQINLERLGETRMMNCGELAFIIEYNNNNDIIVQFKTSGELKKCQYVDFKKGNVKSRFTPSIYGVGIIGDEIININVSHTEAYQYWLNMLRRCYDSKFHEKQPRYKDCIVCDEWLYFKNFKNWFNTNYYNIEGQKMCLDKDILHKGNKIYSPNNCIFVSNDINLLFTKCEKTRGEQPIGVYYDEKNNKYRSQCKVFNITTGKSIRKSIGSFENPTKAFNSYKQIKEENIKKVADYYKSEIPKELYNAMINWRVEITD